ncbi:MAG: hypothetical protein WDZ41_05035 [Candidatus Babeliales bacterium]
MIELILYLFLFLPLILIFLNQIGYQYNFLHNQSNLSQRIINLYTLERQIIKDLDKAPIEEKYWIICTSQELLWSQEDRAISWSIEKKCMVRKEGHYDRNKHKWIKKSKNIGAQNIEGFFELQWAEKEKKKELKAIILNLTIQGLKDKQVRIQSFIAPKNRNI